MGKRLMKGNDAVVHGALLGGATHFFGYPITPASEIAHGAAQWFTASGRFFLQAESEVAAINMMYGASATGARTMTASSGPGVSLMCEGLSYLAGARLPAVLVDVQRAGPGLGNIWPEQSDYNMLVKGGGHGNYRNLVLAPWSAQEMCDFTRRAFDLADAHRMTVVVLSDAYIGQMMEPVEVSGAVGHGPPKDWAVRADARSRGNLVCSIVMEPRELDAHNRALLETYCRLEETAVEIEEHRVEDASVVLVAYGITARICMSAVVELRERGVAAGLLRPRTLFPFPSRRIRELAAEGRRFITAELSNGMMAEDVESAVGDRAPVFRYLWMGGLVPTVAEIVGRVERDAAKGGAR